jgi:hypothetical protein
MRIHQGGLVAVQRYEAQVLLYEAQVLCYEAQLPGTSSGTGSSTCSRTSSGTSARTDTRGYTKEASYRLPVPRRHSYAYVTHTPGGVTV